MQGIEVLSIFKVVSATVFNWEAFWLIFGVATIGFILAGLVGLREYHWSIFPFCIFLGIFLGCFVGFLVGATAQKPIAYENQYKVTISEEVSMVEFLDRYEIIEQEGKIFTIREKVSK